MDKNQAVNILDETFNNDFNVNRFSKFIKELLNNFEINSKSWTVWEAFQEYIDTFQLLGSYEDRSKKIIDILAVKLRRTSSVGRARTMQRNFIAKWLGNADKDAALVAFYGDDPQDWRFSFVKMEYSLIKDEKGDRQILKELTPAKRYSFLVGVNEPNHTCRRQFLDMVIEENINPSIDEIEAAFSIDNVTKEFFLLYKDLFLKLKKSLEKLIKKDIYVKREFEEKAIPVVDFAKKLLGQIVFIYFLQKKGWLGVKVNEKWGTGPKDFMRQLIGGGKKKYTPLVPYDNFFNEILEPLFYDALANPREGEDGYYRLFKCKIPFLNGGLFEPINDYSWEKTDIIIKDQIFEDIFDVFDRFNFTVKEDEPLEKEVAIDPEMLGKVFENLIEENIRKGQGAYYTPREIVHYMCQQSLINYLETNLSIPREDVETFIHLGDFALEVIMKEQSQIRKYGRSYTNGKVGLPKTIKENYQKIDQLLWDIKIVDPAVGSGAFPVGMMNEIVKARSILSIFFSDKEQKKRTNYNLKRETIENSLYGVDIDSSAVDIAKLRFWLSLIVDEMDMKNIKPLPNLDHKIMCGNSLLEEFEGIKLFDDKLLGEVKKDTSYEIQQIDKEMGKLNQELHDIHTGKKKNHNNRSKEIQKELKRLEKKKQEIIFGSKEESPQYTLDESIQKRVRESQKKLKELKILQNKFFNQQNRKLKIQLREEIEKIEWELIEETLKEQGREDSIKKLEQYKLNKSKPFFLWKLYFSEIFTRKNPGFDVVIANPPYGETIKENKEIFKEKYFCTEGKYEIYKYFFEKGISLLRDYACLVYISPDTWLTLGYFKKLRRIIIKDNNLKLLSAPLHNAFESVTVDTIVSLIQKDGIKENIAFVDIRQNKILKIIDKGTSLSDNEFVINIKDSGPIISKMNKLDTRLDDISEIWQGLIAYSKKKQARRYTSKKKETQFHRKLLFGSDMGKYFITWKKGLYLKYGKWLHRPRPSYIFDNEKILVQRIRNPKLLQRIQATIDKNKYLNGTGLSNILILDEYKKKYFIQSILGIINSKLINYWFSYYFHDVNIKPDQLRKIPIAFNSVIYGEIRKLVDKILEVTKDSKDFLQNTQKKSKVKQLEKEINKLVYRLYDLTSEEIKIVEEFSKEK